MKMKSKLFNKQESITLAQDLYCLKKEKDNVFFEKNL